MNEFEIKTDCFGFDKTKNDCKVLRKLYCECEKCRFYKTKEQYRKDLKKSGEYCVC